jgi:hypothetical protein
LLTSLASRSLSTTSGSFIVAFTAVVAEGAYFRVVEAAGEEACFRVEAEAAVDPQHEPEAVGVDLYSLLEELPAGVPVVVAEHDPESLVQAFLDS